MKKKNHKITILILLIILSIFIISRFFDGDVVYLHKKIKYNGIKYNYCEQNYFSTFGDTILIGDFSKTFINYAYYSENDEEINVLTRKSKLYLKENYSLPTLNECTFSDVYLYKQNEYAGMSDKYYYNFSTLLTSFENTENISFENFPLIKKENSIEFDYDTCIDEYKLMIKLYNCDYLCVTIYDILCTESGIYIKYDDDVYSINEQYLNKVYECIDVVKICSEKQESYLTWW